MTLEKKNIVETDSKQNLSSYIPQNIFIYNTVIYLGIASFVTVQLVYPRTVHESNLFELYKDLFVQSMSM